MVCLGNICRSPMAEAILKHRISRRASLKGKMDISVESAGTGAYHEGDEADERTVATCRKHGIPISCTARKVISSDFASFTFIMAMDESNLQTLQRRRPAPSSAHISLFGVFDPTAKARSIEDPYYGGLTGFEQCFEQCVVYADGFLDFLEQGLDAPTPSLLRRQRNGDGEKVIGRFLSEPM